MNNLYGTSMLSENNDWIMQLNELATGVKPKKPTQIHIWSSQRF